MRSTEDVMDAVEVSDWRIATFGEERVSPTRRPFLAPA
jgi:hypothetical protein